VGVLVKDPVEKPYGRLAWAFYLGPIDNHVPYIDLSVMPCRPASSERDESTRG
jgi:hypothetical protein